MRAGIDPRPGTYSDPTGCDGSGAIATTAVSRDAGEAVPSGVEALQPGDGGFCLAPAMFNDVNSHRTTAMLGIVSTPCHAFRISSLPGSGTEIVQCRSYAFVSPLATS